VTDETDSTTEQALSNLQKIKQGNDPRSSRTSLRQGQSDSTDSSQTRQTRVEKVQDELDRLFAEHEMPDSLDRKQVNGYVADWQRKIGNCKYNTYLASKEYGKRVTGRQYRRGDFAIGIAKRAFDSDETWLDTVAHELAHVTAYIKNGDESAGHSALWKSEADRLGADPTRTDRVAPENRVEYDYFLGCPNGCFRNGKQRRGKRVQKPHLYRCPECDTSCVSWSQGDPRPSEGGTCAVDVSDL
jgi:predicted SprT family Zn-dependent metalloprotease